MNKHTLLMTWLIVVFLEMSLLVETLKACRPFVGSHCSGDIQWVPVSAPRQTPSQSDKEKDEILRLPPLPGERVGKVDRPDSFAVRPVDFSDTHCKNCFS